MANPDLTVVIPTLDEGRAVPLLIEALAAQTGLCLEVVVADGGSRDGAPEEGAAAAGRLGIPLHVVTCGAGRGRQMNRGARLARAPNLLFLHADSALDEPALLTRALGSLTDEHARRGTHRVAGHFGLRFLRHDPRPSAAYYFFEAKTYFSRPGCVNGDQGFLVARSYFEELGGFDESLPYLEDARFAREVFRTGAWVTLPGRIGTSARRFEAEGLWRRQALNALVLGVDAVGLRRFFAAADAYREQGRAGRIRLGPFLRLAHRESRAEGPVRWLAYWYRAGSYVAGNAWQAAFALDCRRNRRAGLSPGEGPTPWLERYDRWCAQAAASRAGCVAAALAAAGCFFAALVLTR